MCGLCGYVSIDELNNDEIIKMTESISHRGPDSQGVLTDSIGQLFLGLGHRRLSIIDLDERSNQPMYNGDKTLALLYNGEIYNYKELKKECYSYKFKTESDSEVILALYQSYGLDFATKLVGIFSIVIIDFEHNKIILIRDRHGVKPLYYLHKENFLVFSSELRPIISFSKFDKSIDPHAVKMMLSLKYIPAPFTVFQDVKKVLPGTVIEFTDLKKTNELIYWENINEYLKQLKIPLDYEEHFLTIENAVKRNLVGDVEIASFLSGGVDSSLVTALAQKNLDKLVSYTAGFNSAEHDESIRASRIALELNVDNKIVMVSEKELVNAAMNVAEISDEPFGDSSLLPTYILSKQVNLDGKKVVLSGDGGDEFYFGYNSYDSISRYHKYYNFINPLSKRLKKLSDYFPRSFIGYGLRHSTDLPSFYFAINSGYPGYYANKISKVKSINDHIQNSFGFLNKVKDLNPLEIKSLFDQKVYMIDDVLHKVDRASMACSLESRVPLLDHPVSLNAYKTTYADHLKFNEKKQILKKLLNEFLSKDLIYGPKKGFSVPEEAILRNDQIKNKLYLYLERDFLEKQGLFRYKDVKKNIESFYNKTDPEHGKFVWNYFVFQSWYSKYILKIN
jgi:asparagine synthase (glutamine-hydrolysing)